jgi:hypothetical protein
LLAELIVPLWRIAQHYFRQTAIRLPILIATRYYRFNLKVLFNQEAGLVLYFISAAMG